VPYALEVCAVLGQDHERKVYYERAIQTLEQQLREFQERLIGTNVHRDGLGAEQLLPADASDDSLFDDIVSNVRFS
jgi:hypothetical protein